MRVFTTVVVFRHSLHGSSSSSTPPNHTAIPVFPPPSDKADTSHRESIVHHSKFHSESSELAELRRERAAGLDSQCGEDGRWVRRHTRGVVIRSAKRRKRVCECL